MNNKKVDENLANDKQNGFVVLAGVQPTGDKWLALIVGQDWDKGVKTSEQRFPCPTPYDTKEEAAEAAIEFARQVADQLGGGGREVDFDADGNAK